MTIENLQNMIDMGNPVTFIASVLELNETQLQRVKYPHSLTRAVCHAHFNEIDDMRAAFNHAIAG